MTDLQKRLSEVFGYTGGKWLYNTYYNCVHTHDDDQKLKPICRESSNNDNKSDYAIISKAPEMLGMLWDRAGDPEHMTVKPDGTRTCEIEQFFLSIYQEIHREEISWEELKKKIEGVENE